MISIKLIGTLSTICLRFEIPRSNRNKTKSSAYSGIAPQRQTLSFAMRIPWLTGGVHLTAK